MTDRLYRDIYRYSFPSFVRLVFGVLHPDAEFIDNWHIELICDRLMKCANGDIKRLAINLPPRYLKSLITSIAWPLFLCGNQPNIRIGVCAGSFGLATDFDEQRRRVLASKRVQAVFPSLRMMETRGRIRFVNGSEIVQSVVLKSQMGRGADIYVIDDPQSAADVEHPERRATVATWFSKEVVRGLNKKASSRVVIVMQRLHPEDLCGSVCGRGETWEHLVLPAVSNRDESWTLADGTVFRRRPHVSLSPLQEDETLLRRLMLQIGATAFYAQYLQSPTLGGDFRGAGRIKSYVYDGWDPSQPMITGPVFVRVTDDIDRDYFGIPDPRFDRPGVRLSTRAEWEAAFKYQQVKLRAETLGAPAPSL